MAFRSDITFEMDQSPRVITVLGPSTELTIQDLHDTCTDFQDSIVGSEFSDLIATAGKENLGGGVSVGLTSTLQNAQVAFEVRADVHESGTVTTPDTAGRVLTDSTALFVTNGVNRGDAVLNDTDGSQCNVLSVDSETQLTCQALVGGVDNQFGSADVYRVFHYEQCQILGGNLVAIDDVGADLDPVFVTFGTQVIRTSSSSATLQELSSIQFASFNGAVTIDVANISGNAASGTTFPTGTLEQPVDNLTDAAAIAASRGLSEIDALGDLTITSGTWDNFQFVGQSRTASTITVNAAASVIGAEFRNATVQGTLDDDVTLTDCTLVNLTDMNGVIERCLLTGTITLGGSKNTEILDSWGGFDIGFTPVIDMGGSGQGLAARRFTGSIQLENKTGSEEVVVEFGTGHLTLAATYGGAGFMTARGSGRLTNLGATSPLDVSYFVRGERITDIWRRDGLDVQRPTTVGKTGITDGDLLTQTYIVNPDGSVTVTRTA